MQSFKKHPWKYLAAAGALAAIAGVFIAFGPPGLMARTEAPIFCASCHAMQGQYEAWFNVGAHRGIRCVDCHLPHENLPTYYVWKSIDGMKDVIVFYSGNTPEVIQVSERGQKFIQNNCIRCHSERVARIDQDRNCWDCHRFLQHQLAGVRLSG
ncbi:cytochrome c nitrite reductase small subunit [Desulfococcus sp.]|uniref:cytochrome c nitrite reductase small subunit n=1 Tax=Desulfococcus sp. TaxID=2025834 RepID=UPI0035941278